MSSLSDYQFPPPSNWEKFEDLCFDLWRLELDDPNTSKHGRRGQAQMGVDVHGQRKVDGNRVGIQCKGKDNYAKQKVTTTELDLEIKKAKQCIPKLNEFILATTGPKDVLIEMHARKISARHEKRGGLFSVQVFAWKDILDRLDKYPNLQSKYFSNTTALIQANADHYLNTLLNTTRDLIRRHFPAQAIEQLKGFRDKHWSECSNHIKYRITAQLGDANIALLNFDTAADNYIDALQYKPTDEDASCKAVQGFIIRNDLHGAQKIIGNILVANPYSIGGIAAKVATSPKSKSYETILNLVPKVLQSNPRIMYSLAHIARDRDRLCTAKELLISALDLSTEGKDQYRRNLADIIMAMLNRNRERILLKQPHDSDSDQLELAYALYSEVINEYTGTELKRSLAEAHANRGLCCRLKGNLSESIADLETACKLAPENLTYLQHRAYLAKEIGKLDIALELFESLLVSRKDPAALLGLAATHHEKGNDSKALEILTSQAYLDSVGAIKIEGSLLKIRALLNCNRIEEAQAETQELSKQHGAQIVSHLCRSWIYAKQGNSTACIVELRSGFSLINSATSIQDIARLADAFFDQGKYVAAKRLYKKFVNNRQFTASSKKLLYCMYRSAKLGQVLKFCKTLRANGHCNAFIVEIEASVYIALGDLTNLQSILLDYISRAPSDLHIRLMAMQVLGKQMPKWVIEGLATQQLDLDKIEKDDAILFGNVLSDGGYFEKGVEIAYLVRRKYANDARAHLSYVMLFFKRPNGRNDWVNIEKVSVDCSVLCQDKANKTIWITIVPDSADLRAYEFDTNHAIAKALLGKFKGQEVILRQDEFGADAVKILDIRHRYVYAFNESCDNFQKWFPDVPGLWKINIGSTQEEIKAGFEKIRQSLDRNSEHTDQAVDFYAKGELAIGSISAATKSSILDIWTALTQQPKVGIRACQMYTADIESAVFASIDKTNPRKSKG